jgi:hypothetical protein
MSARRADESSKPDSGRSLAGLDAMHMTRMCRACEIPEELRVRAVYVATCAVDAGRE